MDPLLEVKRLEREVEDLSPSSAEFVWKNMCTPPICLYLHGTHYYYYYYYHHHHHHHHYILCFAGFAIGI
jgi:hypothetical protein